MLYCSVPDISLLFNEWDQMKPEKFRKIALQRVPVMGGWEVGEMEIAGVQPLPLCDLRQAISRLLASFSSSEEWVGLNVHHGPSLLSNSVIYENLIFLG